MMSGATTDKALLIAAALAVGVGIALVARRYPKVGYVAWLASVCFVPVWFGLGIGPYWPPATLVGLLLVFAATKLTVPRLTIWDFAVIAFGVIAIVAYGIGAGTISQMFNVLAVWLIPFVAGRVVTHRVSPDFIYRTVAVAFSVVAALAIVEFVTQSNIFTLIKVHNDAYLVWAPLLARGGSLRAEGAFGQPIALGASIALAIPLTMASRFPSAVRTVMVLLMLAGTVVTFSRGAMLCGVIAVALCVFFLRRELVPTSLKAALTVIGIVAFAAALPFIFSVFAAAGTEASKSANYRGDLTSLISQFDAIGVAGSFSKSVSGEAFFGDFHSIDSAVIYIGLSYGVVALVLLLALVFGALGSVVRLRATPPTIAIVAQIPAFATVALITQYAAFVWFIGGLAVSTQLLAARSAEPESAHLVRPSARLRISASTAS